jgi:class 3 adenylate cyclase/tetratricopeptide (TPR) repeat protein
MSSARAIDSVVDWLQSLGLAEYAPVFAQHQITPDVLPHLTETDVDRLSLPIGPRRRLLVAIDLLKAQEGAAAGAASRAPLPLPPASSPLKRDSAAGAERRQLTVMFCDLVGSTALADVLDPEEMHRLIQSYRAACSEVVSRYEGYVAQYLGDGLMVYFGWPVAHEDDAERGVRSALEMVAAVKELRGVRPLAVRIGLATGQVVVGDLSQSVHGEGRLAIGPTPNLAARLQALAGPDEVVIAPTTRRLVASAFLLSDLGARELKGIAQPVQVWRVDEARRTSDRFDAVHGARELAPLVGRSEESARLARRWHRVCEGQGEVVFLGGQPGIGKSRLAAAFRARIAEEHVTLHHQCSPYHLNSPLHPFVGQLELSAGFARDDGPEQKLDKLEALIAREAPRVEGAAPLFAALLSLPVDRYPPLNLSPQKQKERTLEALIGRIEALAERGPVLMVLEDVHWIDPTSQELLQLLVPEVHRRPVLLIVTHRPEYTPSWETLAHVTIIALNRLGRSQGAALVGAVAKGRALPPVVLDEILARTDGVPLFVEEVTRSVLESGLLREAGDGYALQGPLTALAIPASLRDSLMARLDRLGPAKETAQIGACLGREFSHELLGRVSTLDAGALEASLQRLLLAGLVTRSDTGPDAVYTFKHALVQDAAYDSLLKSRRSELHGKIAHVLETAMSAQVENSPETLAHHHTQAGHFTQAIPLWRAAGMSAVHRVALKEAVAHFQNGLALIDQLPPGEARDGLELTIREPLNAAWTGLSGWAAPEVGVNAAAILRLAERLGNAESLLLARWWLWTSTITQGRIADSQQWVAVMRAEGGEHAGIDQRIFGHTTAMVQCMLHGELQASREEATQALALYDPARAAKWMQLTGHDLATFVEVYACQLTWMLGYPDQAERASAATAARARAAGHAFNLVWALTFSAYVFAYRREPDRFLERVDEANQVASEQGLAFISQVSVPQARGIAELQNGRPREAQALLRQGIERWTSHGGRVRVPFVKAALAEAVALDGDLPGALALIDECAAQIAEPWSEERLWLAEVLRLKGWMLARAGRHDEAEALLNAAIGCARAQGARSWELRAATTLARHLASRGRAAEGLALLGPAYGWFTEGWNTRDLLEAKALLDELGPA